MADQPNLIPPHRRHFLLGTAAAVGGITMNEAASAEEAKSKSTAINPRLFSFIGGKTGEWEVISTKTIVGEAFPAVSRIHVQSGLPERLPEGTQWILKGATSNDRYLMSDEKRKLTEKQVALGREKSTHAALIPIRKNAKWWALTTEERRAIFEEQSKHISVGMKYLPEIARRLHHCRDLSEPEPFDFLTYFDFEKNDINAFDDMLATMRASEEWKYIDWEIDIRLQKIT